MLIEKLWATPVAIEEIRIVDPEKLYTEIKNSIYAHGWTKSGVWAWPFQGENIDLLRNVINTSVNVYAKEAGFKRPFKTGRSWIVETAPGDKSTSDPHCHHTVKIVCVYYIRVDDNAGDILLQDPRGAISWTKIVENGQDSRVFKRITPKAGQLIIFPGYVIHSVTPNFSSRSRISLATNMDWNNETTTRVITNGPGGWD